MKKGIPLLEGGAGMLWVNFTQVPRNRVRRVMLSFATEFHVKFWIAYKREISGRVKNGLPEKVVEVKLVMAEFFFKI